MKALTYCLSILFATLTCTGALAQVVEMEEMAPVKPAATAQSKSRVFEIEENMVMGPHNALVVNLEVTSQKLVEKLWKDFMKDYNGKTKGARGGKEDVTTEASIVGINGVNPLIIYSRTGMSEDGYVELFTWFDLGEDYLDSSRRSQYNEAEAMLLKFAHQVKVEGTRIELGEAEDKLKSFEKEMDKLKRQNTGYHKDIEEAEKRIETAKENIVKNEGQQADTTQKIDLQQQLVEEIKRRLADLKNQ